MNFRLAPILILVVLACTHSRKGTEAFSPVSKGVASVGAVYETTPVPSKNDAADDPCIWVHPLHPESSYVIGTDKNRSEGGLHVYALTGEDVHFTRDPGLNNVDVRYGFKIESDSVDIVAASRRTDSTIALYSIDASGTLTSLEQQKTRTVAPYGCCLYKDRSTKELFYFVAAKSGAIEQYLLQPHGKNDVRGLLVRTLHVPSQAEGCVADDHAGLLYVGEEEGGIWRFEAHATGDTTGKLIASADSRILKPDVEGLCIVYLADTTKVLLASSQGNSTFAAFSLNGAVRHLASFRIRKNAKIDKVSGTDGIDALAFPLGPVFPSGIFVAQDDHNPGSTQNFKIVPFEKILELLGDLAPRTPGLNPRAGYQKGRNAQK